MATGGKQTVVIEAAPGNPAPPQNELVAGVVAILAVGVAITLLVAFLLHHWNRLPSIWTRSVCAALVLPAIMAVAIVVVLMAAEHRNFVDALSGLAGINRRGYMLLSAVFAVDWLAAIALLSLIRWRARVKRRKSFGVFE